MLAEHLIAHRELPCLFFVFTCRFQDVSELLDFDHSLIIVGALAGGSQDNLAELLTQLETVLDRSAWHLRARSRALAEFVEILRQIYAFFVHFYMEAFNPTAASGMAADWEVAQQLFGLSAVAAQEHPVARSLP